MSYYGYCKEQERIAKARAARKANPVVRDRRVYMMEVEESPDNWAVHRVGKFSGLDHATRMAEQYGRQVGKPCRPKFMYDANEGGLDHASR